MGIWIAKAIESAISGIASFLKINPLHSQELSLRELFPATLSRFLNFYKVAEWKAETARRKAPRTDPILPVGSSGGHQVFESVINGR